MENIALLTHTRNQFWATSKSYSLSGFLLALFSDCCSQNDACAGSGKHCFDSEVSSSRVISVLACFPHVFIHYLCFHLLWHTPFHALIFKVTSFPSLALTWCQPAKPPAMSSVSHLRGNLLKINRSSASAQRIREQTTPHDFPLKTNDNQLDAKQGDFLGSKSR